MVVEPDGNVSHSDSVGVQAISRQRGGNRTVVLFSESRKSRFCL